MFHLKRKRTYLSCSAIAVVGAFAMSGCMTQNKVPQTLTLVGSDTTQEVMGSISSQFNADSTGNTDPDNAVNILAQQTSPKTSPGDGECGSITYHTPAGGGEVLAPNGSGAGRDALQDSVLGGNSCVDIARSSGTPRAIGNVHGKDLATFEYYAYALDAVTWASASAHAPANLSLANLQGIYNCTFTNWSQVGGSAGQIQRYWPQAGSGTRSFFQSDVLNGFDPTTVSSGSCPAVKLTEENSGATIAANGDLATAIVPHSAGNWDAQANGTIGDLRNGLVLGSIDGQAYATFNGTTWNLNTAGPVTESNVRLNNNPPVNVGVRYVFNVIDSSGVSYKDAKYFVGFENTTSGTPTAGLLCNGTKAGTISTFGFAPLDATVGPHNLMGSNCRLYTPS
jgi:phosphate transport system substrate-binding protein